MDLRMKESLLANVLMDKNINENNRIMKHIFLITALLFSIGLYSQSIEMLKWKDLLAKQERQDPYLDLPDDARLNLMMAATGRQILKTVPGSAVPVVEFRVDSLVQLLAGQGIDVATIDRFHADMMSSFVYKTENIRKELNGKLIGIPGYLLPLNKKNELATEFLLVPWLGECMHNPRAKNQVIHVSVKNGYQCISDYDYVIVEGQIYVEDKASELYLEGDSANIPSGYSILHGRIMPYPVAEN